MRAAHGAGAARVRGGLGGAGQVLVGCLLPALTTAFSLKAQMLGGAPAGITLEDVTALIAKIDPPPLPVGAAVRIAPGASESARDAGPLKSPEEVATLVTSDGTSQPYQVRTADGVEHPHWFGKGDLVAADA